MSLPLTIDSLEAAPEAVRSFYEDAGEGKFRLKVDGLEDTTALKGALKKERDAAKAARTTAAQFEGLGLTADEIKQLVTEKQEADRKAAEKEGNLEKILAQHRKDWDAKLTAAEQRAQLAEQSERGAVVGTRLLAALTKAGATEEGIELLPDRLASRIKYDTQDGKRVLAIMSADGETPLAGSNKDGTATFEDLAREALTKFPSLFKGSGAGGGGKQQSSGTAGGGKTMPRAQFEQLSPTDKVAQMRAGVKLTD